MVRGSELFVMGSRDIGSIVRVIISSSVVRQYKESDFPSLTIGDIL